MTTCALGSLRLVSGILEYGWCRLHHFCAVGALFRLVRKLLILFCYLLSLIVIHLANTQSIAKTPTWHQGRLVNPPTASKFKRPLTVDSIVLAILSVYNKQGLLDLAKGLIKHDIRLLASGGTAKRESFS